MSFANTSDTRPDTQSSAGRGAPVADLLDRFAASPTMLAVWAHPDDESYLGGGLMAEVARRGGTVVAVTATLGELGAPDPAVDPPAQLAERRAGELQRALATLGTVESHVLGYPDGACEQVPDALGARRVGALIDDVRPDLVVGFGPDGVTGHPDHRAVARWTRLAVAERSDEVPLLTTAAGAVWPDDLLERMHSVGAFWPGYPERTVDGPAWQIALRGRHLRQKLAALECHESQIGPLQDVLGVEDYRRLAAVEAYRPANASAHAVLSVEGHARAA